MNAEQVLIDYFNKVADLAESLQQDIKKDKELSSKTVVLLSKVIAAGQNMQLIVDTLQGNNIKYN